jgi:hypothetical protein
MTPQHPQPPRTRGAAIAAYCRQCIHDPAAAGTWRAQVAVCTCTDCPLWRFRPIADAVPPWIKSRNPADLPEGWTGTDQAAAVRTITGHALEQ